MQTLRVAKRECQGCMRLRLNRASANSRPRLGDTGAPVPIRPGHPLCCSSLSTLPSASPCALAPLPPCAPPRPLGLRGRERLPARPRPLRCGGASLHPLQAPHTALHLAPAPTARAPGQRRLRARALRVPRALGRCVTTPCSQSLPPHVPSDSLPRVGTPKSPAAPPRASPSPIGGRGASPATQRGRGAPGGPQASPADTDAAAQAQLSSVRQALSEVAYASACPARHRSAQCSTSRRWTSLRRSVDV